MNVREVLIPLAGQWTGSSRLWLAPGEEAQESDSTLALSFSAQGKVAELRYTWSVDGEPEDGLLLLRDVRGGIQALWSDSWHTPDGFMLCRGSLIDGLVTLPGSYPAPPGPDWGWRIELDPRPGSALQIRMFNITPDGEESMAVRAVYARSDAA